MKSSKANFIQMPQRHVGSWYSRVRQRSSLKHNILHERQRQTVMPRLPAPIWKRLENQRAQPAGTWSRTVLPFTMSSMGKRFQTGFLFLRFLYGIFF